MGIVCKLYSVISYFSKVEDLLCVVIMLGINQKDKWLWSARCLAHGVPVIQADVLDKLLHSLILWYKKLCAITWRLFT